MLTLIVIIIFVALVFDFLNGFHDAANSIATIVSTRVLSPRQAVIWAAFFNFVAAFAFSTGVASTIGKGLVKPEFLDVYVVFGGLIGAIAWNLITWYFGLPSSSSHALVGGIAGAAVTKAGWGVILWEGWRPLLSWIILAPIIGLLLGALGMIIVMHLFKNVRRGFSEKFFRRMQLVSAAVYSLGHGGNDAQKTMGIIVMLLVAGGYKEQSETNYTLFWHEHHMPLWIILSCHFAIAMGTLSGGWRIVKTMGQKLTHLAPVGGFCAETAAAATIIVATMNKIPISTTHAITGSILGVGTVRGVRAVRWEWGERIIWAWILTIPCSALIASLSYGFASLVMRPIFGG